MSHTFLNGSVYHKRYGPKVHEFTYPFYLLNIDLSRLESLKNLFFSQKRFNLFSFKSKDHFGKSDDFMSNVNTLLTRFELQPSKEMRFITLPRIFNFVFNPISLLVLYEEKVPTHLLAEVHNYNGGRIVYKVKLSQKSEGIYEGETDKDMYVSPFLEREGHYVFTLKVSQTSLALSVDLYEHDQKKLTAAFEGTVIPFSLKSITKLMFQHSFLTLWVVTRTLWQTLRLKLKGLKWYQPTPIDQQRRY